MVKRISMHPHKPHATSQQSLISARVSYVHAPRSLPDTYGSYKRVTGRSHNGGKNHQHCTLTETPCSQPAIPVLTQAQPHDHSRRTEGIVDNNYNDTNKTQPCSHQTAKEQNYNLHTCHLTHHTAAGTPSQRTHRQW